jgi:hypothetical protein
MRGELPPVTYGEVKQIKCLSLLDCRLVYVHSEYLGVFDTVRVRILVLDVGCDRRVHVA